MTLPLKYIIIPFIKTNVIILLMLQNKLKVLQLIFLFQVKMIVMKVSDISNEARPLEVAGPWVDCLLQEFFNQVRIEANVSCVKFSVLCCMLIILAVFGCILFTMSLIIALICKATVHTPVLRSFYFYAT